MQLQLVVNSDDEFKTYIYSLFDIFFKILITVKTVDKQCLCSEIIVGNYPVVAFIVIPLHNIKSLSLLTRFISIN